MKTSYRITEDTQIDVKCQCCKNKFKTWLLMNKSLKIDVCPYCANIIKIRQTPIEHDRRN